MKRNQLLWLISIINSLFIIPACSAQNQPERLLDDVLEDLSVNNDIDNFVNEQNWENVLEDLSVRFEELTRQLITDVDRDSEAYARVFSAFKLPKETDEEKAIRSETIQKESKYAAQVPMEVARTVHSILPMIDVVARKGNSNAVTDACVSMMCARTAILGALLNVRINLTSIKDEKFVKEMSEEADMIEQTTIAEEQKILDYVKTMF